MGTVRPFSAQSEFTIVHNYVLDVLMPELDSSTFKVLMFILRKTVGWHRDRDRLSYSQIREGTGISSNTTVQNALHNLIQKQLIFRDIDPARKEATLYILNTDYEDYEYTIPEFGVTDNVTPSVTENVNTKEKEINNNKATAGNGHEPHPLEALFLEESGLLAAPHPSAAGYEKNWLEPLRQLEITGNGPERIRYGVQRMREIGYTIASPRSIYNTALSWLPEEQRKSSTIPRLSDAEPIAQFMYDLIAQGMGDDSSEFKRRLAAEGYLEIYDRLGLDWHSFRSQSVKYFEEDLKYRILEVLKQ